MGNAFPAQKFLDKNEARTRIMQETVNGRGFGVRLYGGSTVGANAVFRVRICAQIACDRILQRNFSELKPMFSEH